MASVAVEPLDPQPLIEHFENCMSDDVAYALEILLGQEASAYWAPFQALSAADMFADAFMGFFVDVLLIKAERAGANIVPFVANQMNGLLAHISSG